MLRITLILSLAISCTKPPQSKTNAGNNEVSAIQGLLSGEVKFEHRPGAPTFSKEYLARGICQRGATCLQKSAEFIGEANGRPYTWDQAVLRLADMYNKDYPLSQFSSSFRKVFQGVLDRNSVTLGAILKIDGELDSANIEKALDGSWFSSAEYNKAIMDNFTSTDRILVLSLIDGSKREYPELPLVEAINRRLDDYFTFDLKEGPLDAQAAHIDFTKLTDGNPNMKGARFPVSDISELLNDLNGLFHASVTEQEVRLLSGILREVPRHSATFGVVGALRQFADDPSLVDELFEDYEGKVKQPDGLREHLTEKNLRELAEKWEGQVQNWERPLYLVIGETI